MGIEDAEYVEAALMAPAPFVIKEGGGSPYRPVLLQLLYGEHVEKMHNAVLLALPGEEERSQQEALGQLEAPTFCLTMEGLASLVLLARDYITQMDHEEASMLQYQMQMMSAVTGMDEVPDLG